jgi:hypothetical protein
VEPGFQGSGDQIDTSATAIQLVHNVGSNGQIGFDATVPGNLNSNLASGNAVAGFMIIPGGAAFQGNSALGNRGPGVIASFYYDPVEHRTSAFASFTQNNFYGNDRARPQEPLDIPGHGLAGYNPGPSAHCGVLNLGVLATIPPVEPPLPQVKLQATNNFWGTATGPAANDPADAAGGACDQNGGSTSFKPFSPTWFPFVPLTQ